MGQRVRGEHVRYVCFIIIVVYFPQVKARDYYLSFKCFRCVMSSLLCLPHVSDAGAYGGGIPSVAVGTDL